jgi:hypothetical protein
MQQISYFSRADIRKLQTHFIDSNIYHLLSGDFNLDGKVDYLHILNKEYMELWLSSKLSEDHRKIAEYKLSSLAGGNKKNIFGLLSTGAVAGDAELKVASFPHAWPGRGILQDINGDGYLDYAEAIAWKNKPLDLGVYLGDKHGNIAETAAFNLPGFLFKEIGNAVYQVGFLKDINNDGIVDYTQAARGENNYENLDVYLGTGADFVKAGKLPGHAFWIYQTGVLEEGILQDLNGDGIADFSKSTCWNITGGSYCEKSIYIAYGNGVFSNEIQFYLPGHKYWVNGKSNVEAVIADFNGDGASDFIKAARWHTQATDITLHTGNRNGYEAKGKLPDNKFVFWIADPNWQIEGLFADFNADGKLDFCKATIWDDGHKDYWVHLGTDSGFAEQGSFEIPTNIFQGNKGGARSSEVVDVNDDSEADIIKIIEEGGRKRLDIYLSTGSGFVKREINVHERKLTEDQKTLQAWIEDGIFGSHIIDMSALVDSMNLFPAEKEDKVFSFLFPKQKQDERKEQLQQKIKDIIEQKKQFLQEKKEVSKKLERELDEIYKKIEPYNKEIKEEDKKSEPHGSHAANIAGHGSPIKEHLGECMWRVSPNPYSDQACKNKISEKRTKLAVLENEKIAKAAEIKQYRDSVFEQVQAFDTEKLEIEKQVEGYEQLGIEVEEEEIVVEEILQEDMTSPDFVKNDEYYEKYEL